MTCFRENAAATEATLERIHRRRWRRRRKNDSNGRRWESRSDASVTIHDGLLTVAPVRRTGVHVGAVHATVDITSARATTTSRTVPAVAHPRTNDGLWNDGGDERRNDRWLGAGTNRGTNRRTNRGTNRGFVVLGDTSPSTDGTLTPVTATNPSLLAPTTTNLATHTLATSMQGANLASLATPAATVARPPLVAAATAAAGISRGRQDDDEQQSEQEEGRELHGWDCDDGREKGRREGRAADRSGRMREKGCRGMGAGALGAGVGSRMG